MACLKEVSTQHHAGIGHGHGPVQDSEELIYIASSSFGVSAEKARRDDFATKKLRSGDVSLARLNHTPRSILEGSLIAQLVARGSKFEGLAKALTKNLRALYKTLEEPNKGQTIRSVCVLDRVDPGDHDGHAALAFSEEMGSLKYSDKSLGRLRALLIEDIMEEFSDIMTIESIY